jgi:hypothetical protein
MEKTKWKKWAGRLSSSTSWTTWYSELLCRWR